MVTVVCDGRGMGCEKEDEVGTRRRLESIPKAERRTMARIWYMVKLMGTRIREADDGEAVLYESR